MITYLATVHKVRRLGWANK